MTSHKRMAQNGNCHRTVARGATQRGGQVWGAGSGDFEGDGDQSWSAIGV